MNYFQIFLFTINVNEFMYLYLYEQVSIKLSSPGIIKASLLKALLQEIKYKKNGLTFTHCDERGTQNAILI